MATERSPRLSASSSRTGPLGAARGASSARPIVHSTRVERVERRDHQHRGRRDQREQDEPEGGAETPRAQVVDRAQAGDALHAEAQDLRQQRQRHERDDAQAGDQQRLGGQQRDHPPQGAVGEDLQRAPPRVARRRDARRHRRDVGAQEAVGRAAVEPHETPAGGRGAQQQRQPDPGHAQRGAEDEREHGERSEDRDGHVDDEIGRGVRRALEAPVEVECRDHGRPSTDTFPELLSAWMAKGASATASRPRTVSLPDALSASTW